MAASLSLLPRLLAGVAVACIFLPSSLWSQQPTARLIVVVTSAETEEPLRGAQLLIEATGQGGLTNSAGRLHLDGLDPGAVEVMVRFVGYTTAREEFELIAGGVRQVTIAMEPNTILLDEVSAQARIGLRRLASTGFYERKQSGPGTFITRQDIEARRPRVLSDMLRSIPGIMLSATPFSDSRAGMRRSTLPGTTRCPIQYFIDGVPAYGYNIDDMPARAVEGMEIYRGPSELPSQFNRASAMCGAIVIWTRID